MAFPTVASITETLFATNSTAHLVAMPATVAVDDLLISFFSHDGGATTTTPTGWTLLSTGGGGGMRHYIFKKKADGTEGGTTVDHVVSSSEAGTAQVYRVLAANWSGTLTEVEGGTSATGTSVNPDSPALTPTGGAKDFLFIASTGYDADGTVSAYPTSYTNGTNSVGSVVGAGIGTARRELNATSDNPATFTISASVFWVAQTIVVPPSAGAGTFTATAAVTQEAQTSSVSGTYTDPPITGTVGVTQASHTSSASGTFTGAGGGSGPPKRLLLGVG